MAGAFNIACGYTHSFIQNKVFSNYSEMLLNTTVHKRLSTAAEVFSFSTVTENISSYASDDTRGEATVGGNRRFFLQPIVQYLRVPSSNEYILKHPTN